MQVEQIEDPLEPAAEVVRRCDNLPGGRLLRRGGPPAQDRHGAGQAQAGRHSYGGGVLSLRLT